MKAMQIILTDEKDLKESEAPSQTIRDFPSILKEDSPEALTAYLAAFAKESANATKKAEVAMARKQKTPKSEATNSGVVAAPKRKRGKADSHITLEAAQRAWEEIEADEAAGIVRPPKRQAGEEIVCPMFEMTPELAKKCDEYYENLKNEKKRMKAQCRIDRDKALAAMGIEHDDQHLIEKVIEVQTLPRKLEEGAVKGAKKVLVEAQGTSVADASGSVPQVAGSEAAGSEAVALEAAASEAAVSEATQSAQVNQIPVPQTSPSSSSSTDSDLDDIPLSHKYNLTKPFPKAKRTVRTKTTTSKSKLSPKAKPFKEASFDVYKQ